MCRSTIGRVISVDDGYAVVDLEGVRRRASTLLIPDLEPDELVLIGLGSVLGRVEPADLDALRALEAEIPIHPTPPIPG
jgi:hydrogenase maturation factor